MIILLEDILMILGSIVLISLIIPWPSFRSDFKNHEINSMILKRRITKKAATNYRRNSKAPNFQAKELSSLNTAHDISNIKTNEPSKPADDEFLGFQKFEFSSATTINKKSNFKKNEIPSIETKGELLSFQKYTADEGDAHKIIIRNIRTALHEIINNGKAGILLKSITHKTGLSRIGVLTLLDSLTKNNFTMSVNSSTGIKYYLTNIGKQYCHRKDSNITSY